MNRRIFTAFVLALSVVQASAQCAPCTIPFVASSQATGNSTGVTVAKPTGVVQNDVMLAAIHVGWCNSGSSITPPAGWTLINSTSNTGSGCGAANTTIQLATFYKVAGAAEPISYTFTGTTNQFYVGGIVAYSGVNTVTPINANSNFGAQDLCNNIVANSVTTTASCTRLVAIFFCSVNNSLNNIVPQVSLTERVDVGTTGNHPWGNENLEMADEMMLTAGATGNKTASLNGCSSSGWVTGGQLIALVCNSGTGINDNPASALFSVSPNPSPGIFTIESSQQISSVEITNILGEQVFQSEINNSKSEIDLHSKAKGIYFVRVKAEGEWYSQKIIIE